MKENYPTRHTLAREESDLFKEDDTLELTVYIHVEQKEPYTFGKFLSDVFNFIFWVIVLWAAFIVWVLL